MKSKGSYTAQNLDSEKKKKNNNNKKQIEENYRVKKPNIYISNMAAFPELSPSVCVWAADCDQPL